MAVDDNIRVEKLQYNINKEAAKISALSSGKIDKYEYLKGDKILPSNQRQIIQQVSISPLGKAYKNKQKRLKRKEKNK